MGKDLGGVLEGHEHRQNTFYEILKEIIKALFLKQLTNAIANVVSVYAESICYL